MVLIVTKVVTKSTMPIQKEVVDETCFDFQ